PACIAPLAGLARWIRMRGFTWPSRPIFAAAKIAQAIPTGAVIRPNAGVAAWDRGRLAGFIEQGLSRHILAGEPAAVFHGPLLAPTRRPL
ncbi:TPA: hypothetical protein ACRN2U_004502, partial [Pseudomonas aeruginosa]